MKRAYNRALMSALPIALSLYAAPATAADSIVINGRSVSADVRTISGSPYVNLDDIARALGMTVSRRPDGKYELVHAGGANQAPSVAQGRVGDVLFDGKWRFQVVTVQTPEFYTMKTDAELYDSSGLATFDRRTREVRPRKDYSLVVVQCRVANGVKERRTLWTAISDPKIRTSLTDMNGSSHPPIGYDFEGGPIQTKWLLPGASMDIPILFCVPNGTKLKDLVFTLKNNQGDEQGRDVRVTIR